MATSYLDITKDNLSQFSKDIFTKVKDEKYLTSVDFEDLVPLASKTYQNIIATANTQAEGTFYCLQIFPDDVYTPCRIKLRVRAYLNSDMTVSTAKSFYQEHYIEFVTMGTSFVRYVTDNEIYSTSYRPIYYNTIYRALADGITAGYPHYFGPSLYNSTSPTSSSYKRNFEIDVFEIEGGSFTFLDEPVLASSFYNSTYYNGITNINATAQGKIGTGMSSSNTYDRAYLNTVTALAATTLYGSQLLLSADGYNYYSITQSRSTGTSHVVNQVPFDPTFLYYYNSTTQIATGSRTAINVLYTDIPFDFRYSSNCSSSLTAQKPVYLVATKDSSTGLYTLISSNWWTQSPSDENYYYIYLGIAYATTSIHMEVKHPIYIIQNGNLILEDELHVRQEDLVNKKLASLIYCENISDMNTYDLTNNYMYILSDGRLFVDKTNLENNIERLMVNNVVYVNSESIDTSLIGEKGVFYVYEDKVGESSCVKIGDGLAYLVDIPFIDQYLTDHIADTNIHIKDTEREFWNNKVSCYLDSLNTENLIFTTG